MSLADKAFNIAIGPACAVEGCPGKRKTAALSKATVNFVQVIKNHHPIKYQGTVSVPYLVPFKIIGSV